MTEQTRPLPEIEERDGIDFYAAANAPGTERSIS